MNYNQLNREELITILGNYGFNYGPNTQKKTLIKKCRELDETHYSPIHDKLLTGWELELMDEGKRTETIYAIDAWKDFF